MAGESLCIATIYVVRDAKHVNMVAGIHEASRVLSEQLEEKVSALGARVDIPD